MPRLVPVERADVDEHQDHDEPSGLTCRRPPQIGRPGSVTGDSELWVTDPSNARAPMLRKEHRGEPHAGHVIFVRRVAKMGMA